MLGRVLASYSHLDAKWLETTRKIVATPVFRSFASLLSTTATASIQRKLTSRRTLRAEEGASISIQSFTSPATATKVSVYRNQENNEHSSRRRADPRTHQWP